MSVREAERKALRLLTQSRVQVLEVAPRHVLASVRGDTAVWRCGYSDGAWWCDCPAFGRCSHLLALRRVVPAPLQVGRAVSS